MAESDVVTTTSSPSIITTIPTPISEHACKLILYSEIPNTRIRIWDLIILIPNLLFLLFLIVGFNKARLKLRATNSPIYFTFYCLVHLNVSINIIRCLVSMTVNSSSSVGGYTDIVLWVIVRFFLLVTEMSVVIFALAFGHLDSRSSIRYVLCVTSLISLVYSICQGCLEVLMHDYHFHVPSHNILLFGHGGVLFWFVSSLVFSLLYSVIFILPWTRLRERYALPGRRSFYVYVLVLLLLNASCSVGGGLLLFDTKEGLCIVDIATCIYFTLFTPLVYYTFLNDLFEVSQPSILVPYYKNHSDEPVEDDNVSLPHQQSLSSLKTDSDYIYQTNSVYGNTQFNIVGPVNPLYVASLQSPDSITGYSIDSQSMDLPTSSKS